MRRVCVLFMLLSQALSCVKYTFEKDFNELFTSEGFCTGMGTWEIGKYEDLGMEGLHVQSTQFMYPNGAVYPHSCVASFPFNMSPRGRIEAIIFMANHVGTDMIQMLVFDEAGRVAGSTGLSGSDFEGGWYTMTLEVLGLTSFRSQLHIFGMSSPSSTVLVDSFRYIPPGMDPNDCEIYEKLETTSTTVTTESTTTEYIKSSTDNAESTNNDFTNSTNDIQCTTEGTIPSTEGLSIVPTDSTTYYTTERSTEDITQDTTKGTTVKPIDDNTDYTTEHVKSTTDSAASTKDDSVDDTDDIKCTTESNVPSTEGLSIVPTDSTTETPEDTTEPPPQSIPQCPIEKVIKIEINASFTIKFG